MKFIAFGAEKDGQKLPAHAVKMEPENEAESKLTDALMLVAMEGGTITVTPNDGGEAVQMTMGAGKRRAPNVSMGEDLPRPGFDMGTGMALQRKPAQVVEFKPPQYGPIPDVPQCPASEWSPEFIVGMLQRMAVSFHKYGPIDRAFPHKVNAVESMGLRMRTYFKTGNTEFLIDAANFAMIEFMKPGRVGASFRPTDAGESPGRIWHGGGSYGQFLDNEGNRPQ